MAPPLRVSDTGPGVGGSDVGGSYVGFGPFGERTASLLSAMDPRGRTVRPDALSTAFAQGPSVVVAAFWRPSPAVCEQLDALSRDSRVPWLPIIVEHPVIRIGPLVEPPPGVCFRCYRRRCAQHDAQRHTTAALHGAYDRDPALGPSGFLPHHARLAANIAGGMLRRRRAGGPPSGAEVLTVRLFGQDVSTSSVTAFGDCDRCGGGRGGRAVPDSIGPVLKSIGRIRPDQERTNNAAL